MENNIEQLNTDVETFLASLEKESAAQRADIERTTQQLQEELTTLEHQIETGI